MKQEENKLSLQNLTKGNVWELSESDIFAMWNAADKEYDLDEDGKRYLGIVRLAFDVEEVKIDKPEIIKKYEARGMQVGTMFVDGKDRKMAIKKHPINRITDLTYENIHHISAAKLLEVIDRNFGGGWDSITQSIRDIIEDGFDITTTTVPASRLHKLGGLYELKVKDNYEVLEIEKGSWVEAIFAKVKPKAEKLHVKFNNSEGNGLDDDNPDDDSDVIVKDTYYDQDDDELDEDELTQESYRTTIEQDPDDLSLDSVTLAEDGDDY